MMEDRHILEVHRYSFATRFANSRSVKIVTLYEGGFRCT
jgi:hypothetical protein